MPKKAKADQLYFEISLSVLNHLGRKLYRSFITVLGEAISNAWDADSTNVWIYIDTTKGKMVIKDDGHGMTKDDFQEKFLKIGYSKRKDRAHSAKRERPFIGRKGIGKLALLSCAERITVVSKVSRGQYVGGNRQFGTRQGHYRRSHTERISAHNLESLLAPSIHDDP
jgi:DNA topoisomerase VI subunit B